MVSKRPGLVLEVTLQFFIDDLFKPLAHNYTCSAFRFFFVPFYRTSRDCKWRLQGHGRSNIAWYRVKSYRSTSSPIGGLLSPLAWRFKLLGLLSEGSHMIAKWQHACTKMLSYARCLDGLSMTDPVLS